MATHSNFAAARNLMASALSDDPINELVYAPQEGPAWRKTCPYVQGRTVRDLIYDTGFDVAFPDMDIECLGVGIFGVRASLESVLKPGDRVALCRTLTFDPMESRRRRVVKKERKQPPPRPRYVKKTTRNQLGTYNQDKSSS